MRRVALLLACLALALPVQAGRHYEASDAADKLTADAVVITGAPFTVSLWWQPEQLTANAHWLWYSGDDPEAGISDAYWLFQQQTTGDSRLGSFDSPDNGSVSSGGTGLAGRWDHFAHVERATNDRSAWLNQTTASNATTVDPEVGEFTHMLFGVRIEPNWADGSMGVVAFWDEGLEVDEVRSLAEGAWPPHVSPGSLTFLMDQGTSSPDRDLVGGLSMTVGGSPSKIGIKPVGPRPGMQAGQ